MEVVPVVAAGVVQKVLAVSKLPDGPLHHEIFGLKAKPAAIRVIRLGLEAGLVPVFHVRVEGFVDGVEFLAEVVEVQVVVWEGREAQHPELEPVDEVEVILLYNSCYVLARSISRLYNTTHYSIFLIGCNGLRLPLSGVDAELIVHESIDDVLVFGVAPVPIYYRA